MTKGTRRGRKKRSREDIDSSALKYRCVCVKGRGRRANCCEGGGGGERKGEVYFCWCGKKAGEGGGTPYTMGGGFPKAVNKNCIVKKNIYLISEYFFLPKQNLIEDGYYFSRTRSILLQRKCDPRPPKVEQILLLLRLSVLPRYSPEMCAQCSRKRK